MRLRDKAFNIVGLIGTGHEDVQIDTRSRWNDGELESHFLLVEKKKLIPRVTPPAVM